MLFRKIRSKDDQAHRDLGIREENTLKLFSNSLKQVFANNLKTQQILLYLKLLKLLDCLFDPNFHRDGENDRFVLYEYKIRQCINGKNTCTNISITKKEIK